MIDLQNKIRINLIDGALLCHPESMTGSVFLMDADRC